MKKLLTCETTVLSLFLSLVLAVLTLSWQAHPQANPRQEDPERQIRNVTAWGLRTMLRRYTHKVEDIIRRIIAEKCRKDPHASNCGFLVNHLEVPNYGFSLAFEEDELVFRSSHDERNIPIEDCSKHLIENFFERIITSMEEHNLHEIGPNAIEVHANGLIFGITPGSEFFTFIENLPHEVYSLEDRITRGCEEG